MFSIRLHRHPPGFAIRRKGDEAGAFLDFDRLTTHLANMTSTLTSVVRIQVSSSHGHGNMVD
jgi:hypothetical protein